MATDHLLADLQTALGDSYRIEREILGGGMSRLFLADEPALNRRVVVKVLPPELTDPVTAARFQREIDLCARLQHPHILPVLVADVRGRTPFYIMPYVAGESLRQRLAHDAPLPMEEAVRILGELADAVAFAHEQGIIHRDIKPENVLLAGRHAVLADFGIARALIVARTSTITGAGARTSASVDADRASLDTSSGRETELTVAGHAVGTVAYMSPEQLAGDPVDARSDIYSLAVVGYEMLTGQRPFADRRLPGQQLAAQLNVIPPPIRQFRREAPARVSRAIARALAPDPSVRWPTAAAFRDALEVRGVPRARRRAPMVALGMAAVAALAIVAWRVLVGAHPPPLDANLVAVAPFDVLNPSLRLWREGLVDIFARDLDGAGPLRTVAPTVVMQRWRGRADGASAARLGRSTGAGLAMYGRLSDAGDDSVRLEATLLDVATARPIAEAGREAAATHVDRLTEAVTVDLLRDLAHVRPIAAVRGSSLQHVSLPALKAFLQGEQFFRYHAYDSAVLAEQRAVAIDDSFALAYHRLASATVALRVEDDSAAIDAELRAGALNHGLTPRDSLLILADSLGAATVRDQAAPGTWSRLARRYSTLLTAKARYPDDPEVWFALGEVRMHWGNALGATAQETYSAFAQAISLDRGFAPAYFHAIELSVLLRPPDTTRRCIDAYLALRPTDTSFVFIRRVLNTPSVTPAAIVTFVESSSDIMVHRAAYVLRRWPDSDETALRIFRERLRLAPEPTNPVDEDDYDPRHWLAWELAYRGHVAEAARTTNWASPRRAPIAAAFVLLPGIPMDSLAALYGRMQSSSNVLLLRSSLPWWSSRRDTATLGRLRDRFDRFARLGDARGLGARDVPYAAAAARAYLELARGDTADAMQRFEAIPDSLCVAWCWADYLVRAQLLLSRNRPSDAAALLDRRPPSQAALSVTEVIWALLRARAAARLGDSASERNEYGFVQAVWRHGDASLQAVVMEARDALGRLAADRRTGQPTH